MNRWAMRHPEFYDDPNFDQGEYFRKQADRAKQECKDSIPESELGRCMACGRFIGAGYICRECGVAEDRKNAGL